MTDYHLDLTANNPRCEGMSSRVRELEVNNHALTARLKELQEQLDAQALQNRADMARCFVT